MRSISRRRFLVHSGQVGMLAAVPGVAGATGTIGPNLNGIGDPSKRPALADGATNTPEHIREWITDPNSRKPGTMMPNLQLNQQESTDLTAFLLTLTR